MKKTDRGVLRGGGKKSIIALIAIWFSAGNFHRAYPDLCLLNSCAVKKQRDDHWGT